MQVSFLKFLVQNIHCGRISEICDIAERFYKKRPSELNPEVKLNILCTVMGIKSTDLDQVISAHSEVSRTIKGHTFEVIFDFMMQHNHIDCKEIGGDTNVDREINHFSLQLKTPYMNGCSKGMISYKTHKTHGAKSQMESFDYYHKIDDFADFLVGLVSYRPFHVLIVPKSELPRADLHDNYVKSPMYLAIANQAWLNNYTQLGIDKKLQFPEESLRLEQNECLPISSKQLGLKSDYILRAIFMKDNFRIWDMNMRGFIREQVLHNILSNHSIKSYPVNITACERSDKCDFVLKNTRDEYIRFQIKGLTWKGCKLNGVQTIIDCETQLSRGRVNDHPTQSRLYKSTDFEYLMIAMEPPYSNTLCLHVYGKYNYNWNFYSVPMSRLRKHPKYLTRVFSHQYISYLELQDFLINDTWFTQWKKEI